VQYQQTTFKVITSTDGKTKNGEYERHIYRCMMFDLATSFT
jgi:hypothetical protein